ncbi:unnamed protein product [Leptidea sinapis]|uniref:CRAL-TRIO domain-containing protein n=1 Tax=Leptidea sinapis TaxID=189913 RepID=A0A5E4QCZ1_9NEOP|nr:unnamed protein product [Leptidea sinapis]
MHKVASQALTEKLVKRIVIHDSVESLHKYISKEILPVDFQGDEKSIAELSEANFKELCTEEHIQFLKTLDKAETDESLRLSDKSDAEFMGMPEMYLKELQRDQTRDYLTECCQQISDESRRPTTQYPDDLVGSFKKLDFD